jgi:hypothetical protein
MDKKWKKFERVVAAIHVAENSGATVTWNDHINGRQFDVTIRFKFQFYDYLTLIECKDEQARVEVGDVDAFVTKSRDAGANKAIIVSSSGFQSGAKTVAEKHGIELFTLTEIQSMSEGMLTDNFVSVLVVEPFGFWKTGTKEIINFSKNSTQRARELETITLTNYGGQSVLGLLKSFSQLLAPFDIPGVPKFGGSFPVATKKRQNITLTLMLGTKVIFPGSPTEIPVSHLLVSYWMQDSRLVVPIPPSIQYQYKNERTEKTTTINSKELKLGFETELKAGRFYQDPELNYLYYCESILDKGALLFLIYSYQNGQFVQGKNVVPLSEAKCFFEITDEKEIERLKPLVQQVREKEEKFADTPESQAWKRDFDDFLSS